MKLTENFKLKEFLHIGVDCVPVTVLSRLQELADELQVLRDALGRPVIINSGYRTKAHNKKVGGSVGSQHLLGKAADIWLADTSPVALHAAIEELIRQGRMKQGGLGLYNTFVHYDIRGYRARWDFRA